MYKEDYQTSSRFEPQQSKEMSFSSQRKQGSQKKIIILLCFICIFLLSYLWIAKSEGEEIQRRLKKEIEEKATLVESLKTQLNQSVKSKTAIKESLQEKENFLGYLEYQNAKLKKENAEKKGELQKLNNEKGSKINELQKQLKEKGDLQKQMADKNGKLAQLQKQIKEKTARITELQKQLNQKSGKIAEIEKQKKDKNGKNAQFQKDINEKKAKIEQLSKQIEQKNKKITDFQKQKNEKEKKIADLQKQIKEKAIKTSIVESQLKQKESASSKQNANKQEQQDAQSDSIDIGYSSKDYQPLPVDLLHKDSNQKGVADVLYKSEQIRKQRQKFIEERNTFVRSKEEEEYVSLIKYNLIDKQALLEEGVRENKKDWLRLQEKFKLSSIKEELPMCIISESYNSNAQFRIEANLNSVFLQNYTNFKSVIINDASTDGSSDVYRAYFDFYKIDKARYTYIQRTKKRTGLENVYEAALKECSNNSIVVFVDGSDQMIGRNTLKLLSWGFQTKKAGVIYTNYFYYRHQQRLNTGFTKQYSAQQKNKNLYRQVESKFGNLRAVRAQLFHELKVKDLQNEKGQFFKVGTDVALILPLMELSCDKVFKIEGQFNLLYNPPTDKDANPDIVLETNTKIRSYPKYECSKAFKQNV